jgi:uncharacterized protein (TIGR00730 family)
MGKKEMISDQEIREKIQELIEPFEFGNEGLVESVMFSLIRVIKETMSYTDLKSINVILQEYRKSLKVFLPFRDARKVCIFGSARIDNKNPKYSMTEELADKITREGFMVITGAGGGIMEAGNRGALTNMHFGVNISLPFEQIANPYIANDTKMVSFNYFFNRKVTFVKESDATIVFPGGFGTLDECFEILTLQQTGRCMPRPVILISEPGDDFWAKWREFLENNLVRNKYVLQDDVELFHICDNVDEAISEVVNFYKIYHSMKIYDDTVIMRLNEDLSDAVILQINEIFKDILVKSVFKMVSLDDVPFDAKEYEDKFRLTFNFNHRCYSRIHSLIRFINKK